MAPLSQALGPKLSTSNSNKTIRRFGWYAKLAFACFGAGLGCSMLAMIASLYLLPDPLNTSQLDLVIVVAGLAFLPVFWHRLK
jgi:hypothetical protein